MKMNRLKILYVMLFLALGSGCTIRVSYNSPQEERVSGDACNYITAFGVGDDWMLDMTWEDGSLLRHVLWTSKRHETYGIFDIPLKTRRRPFRDSYPGYASVRYGPYQPTFERHKDGVRMDVTMSHERADFPSEEDMVVYLSGPWNGNPEHAAVSSNGMFIVLDISAVSPQHIRAIIDIYYLTVNGKTPEPHVLTPFVKGEIFTGKRKREDRKISRGSEERIRYEVN